MLRSSLASKGVAITGESRAIDAQGRIVAHPVFPDAAGPAARRIEDQADVREVIALLRLNYERAVARHGLPVQAEA